MSKSQRFSKKDVLVTSKINDEAEVVPIRIDHLVDTDLDVRTGEVSYHYNYLLYTFEHHLGVVTARSYLDDPEEISILKAPSVGDVESELAGIIRYLRTRYTRLKRLGEAGYVEI